MNPQSDVHLALSKNDTNSDINVCFINRLTSYIFSADERLVEYRDALCIVTSDGDVTWLPQAVFKSQCNVDVGSFPFDKQTCKLKCTENIGSKSVNEAHIYITVSIIFT
jgi:hypothetical protein